MGPKKWWHYLLFMCFVGAFVVASLTVMAVSIIYPTLPSLESLTNYQPKLPMKIYSAEGILLGEFGEERRAYLEIDEIPKQLQEAVLAIEDRRFYQHHGVDVKGVLRAIRNNLSGKSREGASTITMQVAKNFFSPPGTKRDLIIKIKETLLAIKIEKHLDKDRILELYLNQIYLGQRSYGFAAASQAYYAKTLDQLILPEYAFLAGLPKAPSKYNPYNSKKKKGGLVRQQEVLRDMKRYGFINQAQYDEAKGYTLKFKRAKRTKKLSADYISEAVRKSLYARYGDDIYRTGMHVYTTIKKQNQAAANLAVVHGIVNYELRSGFRGPEAQLTIDHKTVEDEAAHLLKAYDVHNGFVPAIVTKIDKKQVTVVTKHGQTLAIKPKQFTLIKRYINNKKAKNKAVTPGAVVRVVKLDDKWQVTQLPLVEASLIAINPRTGEVNAMIGGFDFNRNKFNHATQARRQPGSSFKPFIYSAALEKGFTPASMIDDAPITVAAGEMGSTKRWQPKNYDKNYHGPMRIRKALTKSKNMVSIRLLQEIGPRYAQNYVKKFGFQPKHIPAYLSMALGAGSATAWELAAGYATFANTGYQVKPYLISKITDAEGNIIEAVKPSSRVSSQRVIDPRNAFIMTSMMQDVIQHGTARRARVLKRSDIAGKTGTTNDQLDTWFAGYSPREVAIAWVGYDQPKSLGRRESGGRTALPIWIKYMQFALKDTPIAKQKVPAGIDVIKINPETGTQHNEFDIEDGVNEYFYHEFPPPEPEFMTDFDLPEGFTVGPDGFVVGPDGYIVENPNDIQNANTKLDQKPVNEVIVNPLQPQPQPPQNTPTVVRPKPIVEPLPKPAVKQQVPAAKREKSDISPRQIQKQQPVDPSNAAAKIMSPSSGY